MLLKSTIYIVLLMLNWIFKNIITVSIPVQSYLGTHGFQNLLNLLLFAFWQEKKISPLGTCSPLSVPLSRWKWNDASFSWTVLYSLVLALILSSRTNQWVLRYHSISPLGEVNYNILALPFCLGLVMPTGSWRQYLFTCPHFRWFWSCLPCPAVLSTWKTLRKCLIRKWQKRKKGAVGREERGRRRKREGKVKEEMEGMRLGMDGWVKRVSETDQRYNCNVASALDIFSLWKMEIKDHFHDTAWTQLLLL